MSNAGTAYREGAVRGARPVQLVVCLYEQAIEDLRRALTALAARDIGARTQAIDHALSVLGHLQGTLDMNQGGDVARSLDRFYSMVRLNLLEAQFQQSAMILEEQISHLMLLREAWVEVEQATAPRTTSPSEPAQPGMDTTDHPSGEWNA